MGADWNARSPQLQVRVGASALQRGPLVLSSVANCASGMVTPNQTVKSYDSSVFGGNVGAGFNIKVGDPSYRVYIEPRYHYAPTKNVTTRLMVITLGIRY